MDQQQKQNTNPIHLNRLNHYIMTNDLTAIREVVETEKKMFGPLWWKKTNTMGLAP